MCCLLVCLISNSWVFYREGCLCPPVAVRACMSVSIPFLCFVVVTHHKHAVMRCDAISIAGQLQLNTLTRCAWQPAIAAIAADTHVLYMPKGGKRPSVRRPNRHDQPISNEGSYDLAITLL